MPVYTEHLVFFQHNTNVLLAGLLWAESPRLSRAIAAEKTITANECHGGLRVTTARFLA